MNGYSMKQAAGSAKARVTWERVEEIQRRTGMRLFGGKASRGRQKPGSFLSSLGVRPPVFTE